MLLSLQEPRPIHACGVKVDLYSYHAVPVQTTGKLTTRYDYASAGGGPGDDW